MRNVQTPILLHLYEVKNTAQFQAYQEYDEVTPEEMDGKKRIFHDPKYILPHGIADAIYGRSDQDDLSNIDKRLKDLEKKGFVERWKSAFRSPRTGKNPFVYRITKDGENHIKGKWEKIIGETYKIAKDDEIDASTFSKILKMLYEEEPQPWFVKLHRYLAIASKQKAIVHYGELLNELDIIRRKRSPIKGIKSYQETDHELLYGMDKDIDTIMKQIDIAECVILLGTSGAGKTSLLRAGLVNHDINKKVIVMNVRNWKNIQETMTNNTKFSEETVKLLLGKPIDAFLSDLFKIQESTTWILAFDQFEEYFSQMSRTEQVEFKAFFMGNIGVYENLRFIISVRNSSVDRFTRWKNDLIEDLRIDRRKISFSEYSIIHDEESISTILREICNTTNIRLYDDDINAIYNELRDLQGDDSSLSLSHVQIVLSHLQEESFSPGIVHTWIQKHIKDRLVQLGIFNDALKREILLTLAGKETKKALSGEEILDHVGPRFPHLSLNGIEGLLTEFEEADLIEKIRGKWSYVHDFLSSEIHKVCSDDEVERNRIMDMLITNFSNWQKKNDLYRNLLLVSNIQELNAIDVMSLSQERWEYLWLSIVVNCKEEPFPLRSDLIEEKGLLSLVTLIDDENLKDLEKLECANMLKTLSPSISKEGQYSLGKAIIESLGSIDDPEVLLKLLDVLTDISVRPSDKLSLIELMTDGDIPELVRKELVQILDPDEIDEIIINLEKQNLSSVMIASIFKLIERHQATEYLAYLIPYLRPSQWVAKDIANESIHSLGFDQKGDKYREKLAEDTFNIIYSMVEPGSAEKFLPLLNDEEVPLSWTILLLGKSREQRVINIIMEQAKIDHARKNMKTSLRNLQKNCDKELLEKLNDLGVRNLLKNWKKTSTKEASTQLLKIESNIHRLRDGKINYHVIEAISKLIHKIQRANNRAVIQAALRSFIEIGGQLGTRAFIDLITWMSIQDHYIDQIQHSSNIYWDDMLYETLPLFHGHDMDPDLFMELFRLPGFHHYSDEFLPLFAKSAERIRPIVRTLLNEISEHSKKKKSFDDNIVALKRLFCQIADDTCRPEQIQYLLEMDTASFGTVFLQLQETYFPQITWESYLQYIFPLIDTTSESNVRLILEIATFIDQTTVIPQDIIPLVQKDIPDHARKLFIQLLIHSKDPAAFENLIPIMTPDDKSTQEFYFLLISILHDDPGFRRSFLVMDFIDVCCVSEFKSHMRACLHSSNERLQWLGIIGLYSFALKGMVTRKQVRQYLKDPNIIEGIIKLHGHPSKPIEYLFVNYMTKKEIFEFCWGYISNPSKSLASNMFEIIKEVATKRDYSKFLPLLNSPHHRIRNHIPNILLDWNPKRTIPILLLRSILGVETMRMEQESNINIRFYGHEKLEPAELRRTLKKLLDSLYQRWEEVFKGWVKRSDYEVLFDRKRLFELISNTDCIFTMHESEENLQKILGKPEDEVHEVLMPLYEGLFENIPGWYGTYGYHPDPIFGAELIEIFRYYSDCEDICYSLIPYLRKGSKLVRYAIWAFLDHHMDDLYRMQFHEKFGGNPTEGIRLLLDEYLEYEEDRRTIIRFLSQFPKESLKTNLEDKRYVQIAETILKGLEERGIIIQEAETTGDEHLRINNGFSLPSFN